jgi:purine-binding chemotaxis protein CheW
MKKSDKNSGTSERKLMPESSRGSELSSEYDTAEILDQLREEYWQGVTEAEVMQPEGGQVQLMSFWLGDEYYAADAVLCKSVIKFPKIVRVPKSPHYLEGVVNLRGQITSVIDLRKVFGLKLNPLDNQARLLVVEVGDISCAIVIERIGEIINRSVADLREKASGATRMKAEFVKGYFEEQIELEGEGYAKEQLLIYLDLEKVFASRDLRIDYRAGERRQGT